MTRVAGASLAAASTYALHAGFSGTGAEKRTACRVVALHSAVGAGVTPGASPVAVACSKLLEYLQATHA